MDYVSTKFLVSLSDMKDYLDAGDANSTEEGIIGQLINWASSMFDEETDRNLLADDHIEYYDGNGLKVLNLQNYPVNSSVTEIAAYIDGDWDFTEDTKLDSDSIFIKSSEGQLVYKDGVFTRGNQNIKVSYNAGYSTVPYDLRMACMELVGLLWKERNGKNWGVNSISMQDMSRTFYERGFPPRVEQVLRRYRRQR